MKPIFSRIALFMTALLLSACSERDREPVEDAPAQPEIPPEQALTLEAIFTDEAYEAERPGQIKWLEDGSGYTMLETIAGYDEDSPDLDEDGEELEPEKDIVLYDPATGDRSVLVSAETLVPEDADRSLTIDNYAWSDDRSKLLIYTNSQRVWRAKSRGDYWVLDLESGDLRQLGGAGAEPSSLQFAKFSPDGNRVGYVRSANVYVETLSDGGIRQLTSRGTDDIINGIMSWAYEEEFAIRDGFRWSPDGSRIAYWQFDTSGVRDFTLINNTDALYPELTRIPYPKVGETVSAARVGIVPVEGGPTVWAKLPGDPRQHYVPRMDWAENSEEIVVQQLNRKQDTNRVFYADANSGEVSRCSSRRSCTTSKLCVTSPGSMTVQRSFGKASATAGGICIAHRGMAASSSI
ncbi:MAG: DPP IV N-terminal domain-containing protein [Pseudomonadota bacterium]